MIIETHGIAQFVANLAKPQDPDHGVSPKYPGFVPGSNPGQYDEHMNRGAGIYAVHVHQFGGHVAGLPSNYLIPLTYNVPTTRPSNESEAGGENQAQAGRVSSSNNLHIKRKWWCGDLRSPFSLIYSSYSSLLLSSFCSTKMDIDNSDVL